MYEKMHIPQKQLEVIKRQGVADVMSRYMPWMNGLSGVAWLGYLVYVRRYFVAGEADLPVPERNGEN